MPPLNQLRAFEAAARHMSFKDAAEELNVTQAAVSHQIKSLENFLGVQLFQRLTRKVRLTIDAIEFAEDLTRSFDGIEATSAKLISTMMSGTISISVPPFFGNRWLLPRLKKFHALHLGLVIKPELAFDLVDFQENPIDAAIRYGMGKWSGLDSILIHNSLASPVCAPQLVLGRNIPLKPSEISKMTLATTKLGQGEWTKWFSAAGHRDAGELGLLTYDNRAFAFDSALSGNAVVLADLRLTETDVAAGNLVRLHSTSVNLEHGTYVVFPHSGHPDPRILAIAEWMKSESEAQDIQIPDP